MAGDDPTAYGLVTAALACTALWAYSDSLVALFAAGVCLALWRVHHHRLAAR